MVILVLSKKRNVNISEGKKPKKHPQLKDFLPSCCCCCLFVCANPTIVNSFLLLLFFFEFSYFRCNIAERRHSSQLERLFFGLRLKTQNVYRKLNARRDVFCGELTKEEGKRTMILPPHRFMMLIGFFIYH